MYLAMIDCIAPVWCTILAAGVCACFASIPDLQLLALIDLTLRCKCVGTRIALVGV